MRAVHDLGAGCGGVSSSSCSRCALEGVGSVEGLKEKICEHLCDHDRCHLVFALEHLYQLTKAEVDARNALAMWDRRN